MKNTKHLHVAFPDSFTMVTGTNIYTPYQFWSYVTQKRVLFEAFNLLKTEFNLNCSNHCGSNR